MRLSGTWLTVAIASGALVVSGVVTNAVAGGSDGTRSGQGNGWIVEPIFQLEPEKKAEPEPELKPKIVVRNETRVVREPESVYAPQPGPAYVDPYAQQPKTEPHTPYQPPPQECPPPPENEPEEEEVDSSGYEEDSAPGSTEGELVHHMNDPGMSEC